MSVTDDEDIVTCLLRENKELKSALKAERELKNPLREVNDYTNTPQECLQRFEEKVEKIQDNFQKKFAELQRQMANVEDSISMFPQLYPQYMQHWLNNLPENRNVEN